jgi:hypothetical protein
LIAVWYQTCFAKIKLTKLDKKSIPKKIQYTGQIVNAVSFKDSLGHNIVITTETGETQSKVEPDSRDAALYAYHFYSKGDSIQTSWKINDYIKDCPVDLKANYIKHTFAVTDLNEDGKAEVWLMYKTVCHGDVSPSDMKIIMFEAGNKYAVRGTNKVKVSENDYMGGEYKFDDALKKAPQVFRQYAEQLWKKNILETWD